MTEYDRRFRNDDVWRHLIWLMFDTGERYLFRCARADAIITSTSMFLIHPLLMTRWIFFLLYILLYISVLSRRLVLGEYFRRACNVRVSQARSNRCRCPFNFRDVAHVSISLYGFLVSSLVSRHMLGRRREWHRLYRAERGVSPEPAWEIERLYHDDFDETGQQSYWKYGFRRANDWCLDIFIFRLPSFMICKAMKNSRTLGKTLAATLTTTHAPQS